MEKNKPRFICDQYTHWDARGFGIPMQEPCFRQNSIALTEKGSMCTVLVHRKEVTKANWSFCYHQEEEIWNV